MKQSSGNRTKQQDELLVQLTRTVFLADSYSDSLCQVLELIAKKMDLIHAECRSKSEDEDTWSLTCSLGEKHTLIKSNKNASSQNGNEEFFKPSLEVIDEVWIAELTHSTDPLLQENLKHSEPLCALCLHIAFSNGRNDLFRFFLKETSEDVTQGKHFLKKLLPGLKQLLQKKHHEELLTRSERQYRRLFDEDLNPSFIASPEGNIKNCNRAFVHLFNFKSRKAALQSNFNDCFTNYMHQVFFWEALNRGEEINNHEMPATTVDNQDIYLMMKVMAKYDEDQNLNEIVGYIQDITNRKEVEVALRKSEERYRSLIETTNDWIWEIDENYCFTYSSLKVQTILGYDLNSVLGNSIFELMPESDKQKSEKQFRNLAQEQKAFVSEEHAFKDASGNIAIFETSGIPLFNNNGIFQGYRGIAKEITERKRTEEQIARLNDQLENKVIERTKMLQIANKEMEAFSYSVSHDLRAPLRSIDGFSQAFLEDYESILDETGKNYLSRVRSAAQKMSTLIDDMLKLAKVSRTSIAKKEIHLSEIAESIADSLLETDPDRDAEIVIEPDMVISGDKNLIKVALQNLMENAWKFTSKQDITKIEVGSKQIKKETVYYVRDNGAGFDMAYAKKLFAPFQRLHKESDFPGTGIGLSTVQRIVHRHLGKIWAEGQSGSGATFYFTLTPDSDTKVTPDD